MVAFSCLILGQIVGLFWPSYVKLLSPLSESRSGLGGLFEDLGPILGVLAVMVSAI